MPSRRGKGAELWSMYPDLHSEVSELLEDDGLFFNFHAIDDSRGLLKEHDTNVIGTFVCDNNQCASKGWSSKKIAITIRMYKGNTYNARIYHQRCRRCNITSRPTLDGSYAERVAYRLKKWSGLHVAQPPYSGKSNGPHLNEICEGCKNGHCSELRKKKSA